MVSPDNTMNIAPVSVSSTSAGGASIWLQYLHCGTAPLSHTDPGGMYGAVIDDRRTDPIDHST